MATGSRSRSQRKNCVFCKIISGSETTEPLYQDDEIIVFNNIRPASTYHFLVCPTDHIRDASRLNKSHIPLVEKMVAISKTLLEERDADFSRASLGMHWPPFISVFHLHIHVIWPEDKIGFFLRAIGKYNPSTYWFRSNDWLLERLKNLPDDDHPSPAASSVDSTVVSSTKSSNAKVTSLKALQIKGQYLVDTHQGTSGDTELQQGRTVQPDADTT